MFFARADVGTFSQTADAAVNLLMCIKRFAESAAVLAIMCGAVIAQPSNIKITEYPIPSTNNVIPFLQGVTTGPDGALWFTESNLNQIGRITPSGVVTLFPLPANPWGPAACPNLCGPNSITMGPDNALWFTGDHEIGRLATSGVTNIFPTGGSTAEGGITTGPDGALWFTETNSFGGANAIGRITTSGTLTEYALPNSFPTSITAGPDLALWFIDQKTKALGRITTTGSITKYSAPNLANGLGSGYGFGLAVGPDGALWFGYAINTIGRMTTAGILTEYALPVLPGGVLVSGITTGPDGAMWFTTEEVNQLSRHLGRITTGGVVTLYDAPVTSNGQITLGPDGALWYCEFGTGSVVATTSIVRVQFLGRTGVLSQIASGGAWTTVMTLVNTSSAAAPVTVAFHNDDGSALSLPVSTTNQGATQTATTSSVTATMNPNATLLITTGQLASTVVGWADVSSSVPVNGFAIFRTASSNSPVSEGTVPLQTLFPSTVTLAYDNTAGFVMGVALANLSTSSATITATMWDDSGNLLSTQIITIAGSGHAAFILPTQLALTAGKRGIVKFQSATTGGLAGLGLRFSPFGTFTSVPTM